VLTVSAWYNGISGPTRIMPESLSSGSQIGIIELRVLKGTVARMKFVVQRPFQKAKANRYIYSLIFGFGNRI